MFISCIFTVSPSGDSSEPIYLMDGQEISSGEYWTIQNAALVRYYTESGETDYYGDWEC